VKPCDFVFVDDARRAIVPLGSEQKRDRRLFGLGAKYIDAARAGPNVPEIGQSLVMVAFEELLNDY
jgi:hypothetical protein